MKIRVSVYQVQCLVPSRCQVTGCSWPRGESKGALTARQGGWKCWSCKRAAIGGGYCMVWFIWFHSPKSLQRSEKDSDPMCTEETWAKRRHPSMYSLPLSPELFISSRTLQPSHHHRTMLLFINGKTVFLSTFVSSLIFTTLLLSSSQWIIERIVYLAVRSPSLPVLLSVVPSTSWEWPVKGSSKRCVATSKAVSRSQLPSRLEHQLHLTTPHVATVLLASRLPCLLLSQDYFFVVSFASSSSYSKSLHDEEPGLCPLFVTI